jgi:hypothetical protein
MRRIEEQVKAVASPRNQIDAVDPMGWRRFAFLDRTVRASFGVPEILPLDRPVR